MTTIALQLQQHTSDFLVKALKAIAYPFLAISDAIDKQRKINATYNELNRLSDAELRDIGIGRSQIMGIAYESAYGEDNA